MWLSLTVGGTLLGAAGGSRPSGLLLLLSLPIPRRRSIRARFTAPVTTCTHRPAMLRVATRTVQAYFHGTLHEAECVGTQFSQE